MVKTGTIAWKIKIGCGGSVTSAADVCTEKQGRVRFSNPRIRSTCCQNDVPAGGFSFIIMGTVCEWGGEAFLNQNNDEIRRTITLKPKMQQTG